MLVGKKPRSTSFFFADDGVELGMPHGLPLGQVTISQTKLDPREMAGDPFDNLAEATIEMPRQEQVANDKLSKLIRENQVSRHNSNIVWNARNT